MFGGDLRLSHNLRAEFQYLNRRLFPVMNPPAYESPKPNHTRFE